MRREQNFIFGVEINDYFLGIREGDRIFEVVYDLTRIKHRIKILHSIVFKDDLNIHLNLILAFVQQNFKKLFKILKFYLNFF